MTADSDRRPLSCRHHVGGTRGENPVARNPVLIRIEKLEEADDSGHGLHIPDAHPEACQALPLGVEIVDAVSKDPAGTTAPTADQLNPDATELVLHDACHRFDRRTAIQDRVVPGSSRGKVADRDGDGDTRWIHRFIFAFNPSLRAKPTLASPTSGNPGAAAIRSRTTHAATQQVCRQASSPSAGWPFSRPTNPCSGSTGRAAFIARRVCCIE